MTIIIRRTRGSQPQGEWQTNPSWFAQDGDTQVIVPSARRGTTVDSGTTIVTNRYGVAFQRTGAGSTMATLGASVVDRVGPYTIAALIRGYARAAAFQVSELGGAWLPNFGMRLNMWDATLGSNRTITASSLDDKRIYSVIFTFDANNVGTLYVDGRVAGTATWTTLSSDSRAKLGLVSNDSAGGSCALALRTRIVWSPDQVRQFADNPWQVFSPRQIIIPTSTAAATAPTLSALSAINVTATSAQPRMTYTF